MQTFAKNLNKFLSYYPEIIITAVFQIGQFYIHSNKYYVLGIIVLLATFFIYSPRREKHINRILESFWLSFLTVLPLARGKNYELIEVPGGSWAGGYDINLNLVLYFSDFLLLTIVYLIITHLSEFRSKVNKLNINHVEIWSSFTLFISFLIASYYSNFSIVSTYNLFLLAKGISVYYIFRFFWTTNSDLIYKSFRLLLVFVAINAMLVIITYLKVQVWNIDFGFLGDNILGKYDVESREIFRSGGLSRDPNLAATFLVVFTPLLYFAPIKNNSGRNLMLLMLGILFAALIYTSSRGAWIVYALNLIVFIFFTKLDTSLLVATYKKYILIFVIFLLAIYSKDLIVRLKSLSGLFLPGGAVYYRNAQLGSVKNYLTEYPIGIGAGVFEYQEALNYSDGDLRPTPVHNSLGQITVESGYLGLFSYLIFILMVLKRKLSNFTDKFSKYHLAMLMAFINIIVLSLFFPWFLHPRIDWLFWILAAI